MADEETRKLEREAASGDPTAAVRYAHVLEREGRRAEAARVLRGCFEHEAARDALAAYPAWTHAHATAGDTNFIDAEPITKTPRVLWKKKLPGEFYGPDFATSLVASALGVWRVTAKGFEVLHPDSGEERWRSVWRGRAPHWRPRVELRGRELLVWNWSRVLRYELASGKDLGARAAPEASRAVIADGVLYAAEGVDHLAALAIDDRAPPPVLWRMAVEPFRYFPPLIVAGDHFLVLRAEQGVVVTVDRATGREKWRTRIVAPSLIGDADGWVATRFGGPQRPDDVELVLHDARGRPRRRVEGMQRAWALAPGFVISASDAQMMRPTRNALERIDRRSAELRDLPLRVLSEDAPCAVARDVIYAGSPDRVSQALAACREDGTPLWQIESPVPSASVWALAALDRQLFVLYDDNTLVALTDL